MPETRKKREKIHTWIQAYRSCPCSLVNTMFSAIKAEITM